MGFRLRFAMLLSSAAMMAFWPAETIGRYCRCALAKSLRAGYAAHLIKMQSAFG